MPSVKIWYDDKLDGYVMTSPYRQDLVTALKQLIPATDRKWDPDQKIWMFSERWLTVVETIVKGIWKNPSDVMIITKAQSQKAASPPAIAKSKIEDAAWQFIRVLPYEAAQAAYRKAAFMLHPDRGGDMEKMSMLNALWDKISKEVYHQ